VFYLFARFAVGFWPPGISLLSKNLARIPPGITLPGAKMLLAEFPPIAAGSRQVPSPYFKGAV